MTPIRSEPTFGHGFDLIRQLTLQAKAVQTPEELCQAAPNPFLLGTLHLFFPVACFGFIGISESTSLALTT